MYKRERERERYDVHTYKTDKMNITTSIPREIADLAKEKNLKWNEMLILGIKTALNAPFQPKEGEKLIQETYKAKFEAAERRERALQNLLNKIPLEIVNEVSKLNDDEQNTKGHLGL
jgi:hypothetical protein